MPRRGSTTQPATVFVAQFVGSPAMNLIEPGRLTTTSGIDVPSGAALLGIRPHDVRLMPQAALLRGRVQLVEFLGAMQIVHVQTDGGRMIAVAGPELGVRPGRRGPHRSRPRPPALLRFERPEALKRGGCQGRFLQGAVDCGVIWTAAGRQQRGGSASTWSRRNTICCASRGAGGPSR